MKMSWRWIQGSGVALISMMALCGCHSAPSSHDKVHWSYEGDTGPACWGDLSPAFALAKTGKQQSPIDIAGTVAAEGRLECRYKASKVNLVNNGHTIQQDYEPGSFMKAGGKRYELKQFHFHSGSEHTVDGKRYDMELHLVHANRSGELAVVGVLFEKGADNAFLRELWKWLPKESGQRVVSEKTRINVAAVLPTSKACYVYDGSLTTPPCTEGVGWYVLSRPVSISAAQLDVFQALYKGNYRPVQPLNGRTLLHLGR